MQRWDMFCRIVDNYGDIGVCWRLARQLANQYDVAVRLWVDELGVAQRLIAGLDADQDRQTVDNVEICHWREPFSDVAGAASLHQMADIRAAGDALPSVKVADVVIEAFACELPQSYQEAMAFPQSQAAVQQLLPPLWGKTGMEVVPSATEFSTPASISTPALISSPTLTSALTRESERNAPPIWINLEYLCAEPWVESCHMMTSPHPTLPLTKHFFFPGFTAQTGGLLREQGLIEKRDAFQTSSHAQTAFWQKLGVTEDAALKISLFCYPDAPVADLLDSMAATAHPVRLFVPESGVLPVIREHFGTGYLKPGDKLSKDNLTLQVLPFLTQDDYDHLLWACDLNFVRGEDSWVRALWAARPMIWQPYRQQEDTHLTKLQAFLDLYSTGLAEGCNQALRECHSNWCEEGFSHANWHALLKHLPELRGHAIMQADQLAAQTDLAAKLVIFCKNRV